MSLIPFRSVFDDTFGQDWLTFDPFRDAFFGESLKPATGTRTFDVTKQFAPLMTTDVIDCNDGFKVLADLPGVEPGDLEVTTHEHCLFIKAERKHCHDTNTDQVLRLERPYGKVQRKIFLPKNAALDNATTTFKNGVLCVCIPKEEAPAPKKLNITEA